VRKSSKENPFVAKNTPTEASLKAKRALASRSKKGGI